jgi:hypothetical protein
MDISAIAISRAIASLDCDEEIKKCLSALFNEELAIGSGAQVPKNFYVRQVEMRAENWSPNEGNSK